MKTELIDGVLHYVWRKGDPLPSYQLIDVSFKYESNWFNYGTHPVTSWNNDYEYAWPKLLNDRAMHQRMIDEAFENNADKSQAYNDIHENWQWFLEHGKDDARLQLLTLAKLAAGVKHMMEFVQEKIDKEANQ